MMYETHRKLIVEVPELLPARRILISIKQIERGSDKHIDIHAFRTYGRFGSIRDQGHGDWAPMLGIRTGEMPDDIPYRLHGREPEVIRAAYRAVEYNRSLAYSQGQGMAFKPVLARIKIQAFSLCFHRSSLLGLVFSWSEARIA